MQYLLDFCTFLYTVIVSSRCFHLLFHAVFKCFPTLVALLRLKENTIYILIDSYNIFRVFCKLFENNKASSVVSLKDGNYSYTSTFSRIARRRRTKFTSCVCRFFSERYPYAFIMPYFETPVQSILHDRDEFLVRELAVSIFVEQCKDRIDYMCREHHSRTYFYSSLKLIWK